MATAIEVRAVERKVQVIVCDRCGHKEVEEQASPGWTHVCKLEISAAADLASALMGGEAPKRLVQSRESHRALCPRCSPAFDELLKVPVH